ENAVVYQIYPRSFADANGDGIGDLQGIISKLDHLASLNVDAVWISPCFPSPQHDHGYDVADYFDINPEYGDLAVFDELIRQGRQRGIRVLLDVVPNHCSRDHRWFQDALSASPGSRERGRFYFRDGRGAGGEEPPNNWMSIFGGPAWTRVTEPDGTPGQWYLHVFDASQPDLNWENEEVKQHFDDMLTFWFDRGVDGFRVDAVAVVGKTDGLPDGPELREGSSTSELATRNKHFQHREIAHTYWRRWRHLIDDYEVAHPGREIVTVSESYTGGRPELLLRYVAPDQFHQSFVFDLMLAPWIASSVRSTVESNYRVLRNAGASLAWTLNNHDTHRSVTRYGRANADQASSYTGNNLLYRDAPVDLALGTRRSHAMIAFTAALPGTLYLYQGDEFGLPEWLDLPDDRREDPIFFRTKGREKGRDGCRVPLPWADDASTHFGFSGCEPSGRAWLPQPTWWGDFAASKQEGTDGSTLGVYRKVLNLRSVFDPSADIVWELEESESLVAFRRGDVLVVMNMSTNDEIVPAEILGSARTILSTAASAGASVPGNSTVWFR
ncbi:MAG: hypothetical protein RL391_1348, partial [Actinomycetota bacterium]